MSQLGTLYLIPNTLSSPTDINHDTLNAVLPMQVQTIVHECNYFVVETAKVARQFLKAVGTQTPLQELHISELNVKTADDAVKQLLAPVLAGHNLGLLSDAGCPAVADPGARLVEAAHRAGVRVVPLVGPSSILLALMGSGLNGQKFAFHGYLPIDAAQKTKEIKRLEQESKAHAQTSIGLQGFEQGFKQLHIAIRRFDKHLGLCVGFGLLLQAFDFFGFLRRIDG